MTEEKIIFEQDGNIVGITKEGKYFESYKTTENVAILRGAGLYIKRLEQERDEIQDRLSTLADTYQETRNVCKRLIQECEELKCLLVEIQDMASVNAITTCWTVIDNCDNCADKTSCGSQNPLKKLEIIRKKIHEVLVKWQKK